MSIFRYNGEVMEVSGQCPMRFCPYCINGMCNADEKYEYECKKDMEDEINLPEMKLILYGV